MSTMETVKVTAFAYETVTSTNAEGKEVKTRKAIMEDGKKKVIAQYKFECPTPTSLDELRELYLDTDANGKWTEESLCQAAAGNGIRVARQNAARVALEEAEDPTFEVAEAAFNGDFTELSKRQSLSPKEKTRRLLKEMGKTDAQIEKILSMMDE